MMKKVISYLTKPFGENFYYLLMLLLLSSASSAYYWLRDGDLMQAADMTSRGLVVCYCLTFMCGLLKNNTGKCVKIALIILGIVNLVVDKGVYNICHSSFNRDTVGIILGSNFSEASEFSSMYLTTKVKIFVVGILIVVLIVYLFRRNISAVAQRVKYILAAIGMGALLFVEFNGLPSTTQFESSRWDSVFLCKVRLFCSYEKPVDLSRYYHIPKIETTGEQPTNVIVVIGESVSRSHCSLYGYELETQPFTKEIKDSLIIFRDVTAAGPHTITAFRQLWFNCDSQGDEWYRKCTLFSYLAAAGYHQEWISNQASSGVADNAIGCYANLTDTVRWIGTKGLGLKKQDYDGLLIQEVSNAILQSNCRYNCYFVHMMGCHESFQKRCPEEYVTFTTDSYDKSRFTEEQRLRLSQYDNALRYSDYVLRELINVVSDKEAIVIFIPDHALDLYETDASYIGHARTSDAESVKYGTAIPFLVYATDAYRENFVEEYDDLISKSKESFNTKDFTPFMMDICNIKATDY